MSEFRTIVINPKKLYQFEQMIIKSFAIEIGAFNAYEGHALSLARKGYMEEAWEIYRIREDEASHLKTLAFMMYELGISPSKLLNLLFKIIGSTISALCYVSGKRLPMIGAKILETTAVVNYRDMAALARELGRFEYAEAIDKMADQEERHEKFFAKYL